MRFAPDIALVTPRVCLKSGGYDLRVMSLRFLVLAVGVALGVLYPFVAVILGSFGFSPGEIGGITALAALASTLAVLTWGHVADVRIGRTRTLQICVLGASAAALALLVHWPPVVIVLVVLVLYLFVSSYQPLADALTVNAIRSRSGYARVRSLTSLSFAIAAVIAGFLYDRTGYGLAFILFAAASGVLAMSASGLPDAGRADLAAHVAARAPTGDPGDAEGGPGPPRRGFGSAGVALRLAPRLRGVLVVITVLFIGLIASITFVGVRIVELGGRPSDVALASGVSAGAEVPTMFAASWIANRIGLRTMFAAGAALYAVVLIVWAFTDSPTVIIVSRLATGVAFAGVVVSVVLTIATLLPSDLQATGQALFSTTSTGVAAVVSNLVGGALYQWIGPAAVFGVAAALAGIAAAVGFVVFPARSSGPRVR